MPKLELKLLQTFSHFLFDFIQGWLNQLPSLWRWFLTSSNLWHSIAGETRVWNFKFSVLRLLKVESCRLFVYFLKKCGECEWGEIKDGGSTAEQQRSLPLTGERLWHNHDCLLFLTSQSRELCPVCPVRSSVESAFARDVMCWRKVFDHVKFRRPQAQRDHEDPRDT